MKREFGKKLIEDFLPRLDLTYVVDTSKAHIPGHGTPTVILLGRMRDAISSTVRVVQGIQGEPVRPQVPENGFVWSAIVDQIDRVGSESEWVSVADMAREALKKHPWSIGGGGLADLKEQTEEAGITTLGNIVHVIGFGAVLGEDDAFGVPSDSLSCTKLPEPNRSLVEGDLVRDWGLDSRTTVVFPYDADTEFAETSAMSRWWWPMRTLLWSRATFGKQTYKEAGRFYGEYHQIPKDRYATPLAIAFAFVATHNHFVLDRGGKVFNRSAPVIKLSPGATEDDHLALIALLNTSTGCFWMKQIFHNKGGGGIGGGLATEGWEQFYEFTGTGLKQFPVTDEKPLDLAAELDRLARERQTHLPAQLTDQLPLTRADLDAHCAEGERLLRRMIGFQEELDWRCYRLYGITKHEVTLDQSAVPEIKLGERAFEILMAREMAAGELETTWFERHRSTPITDISAHWPEDYRRLVERRIALIEGDRNVGLIERAEYKRRWNQEPWEAQEQRALRGWLLGRLETPYYWPDLSLQTTRRLADRAARDTDFMQVAELYRGRLDFDVHTLVAELVESEAVPFLPVLRYKPAGLRKREVWERTWEHQRREDTTDAAVEAKLTQEEGESDNKYRKRVEKEQKRRKKQEIGDIPPPPKYRSPDFLNTIYWRLRGALDVRKERFVSYPHCSKAADPSLVVAWSGWDHLQQAQALAAYYLNMKEQEGWTTERLIPLLAGLLELIPWIKQWHNDPDPNFSGARMGDYFDSFVTEEARELRSLHEQIRMWTLPVSRERLHRRKKGDS